MLPQGNPKAAVPPFVVRFAFGFGCIRGVVHLLFLLGIYGREKISRCGPSRRMHVCIKPIKRFDERTQIIADQFSPFRHMPDPLGKGALV